VADLGRQPGRLQQASFSPDGNLVVVVADYLARVYDREGKRLAQLVGSRDVAKVTGASGTIEEASFSPDSKLVLTDSGDVRQWQVWDARSGRELAKFSKFTPPGGTPGMATFSPDSRLLITADPAALPRLWDPRSGELVRSLPELRRAAFAAFSPDGDLVAAVSERGGPFYVWETESGQPVATGRWPTEIVRSLQFGPGPERVSVAGSSPALVPVVRRYRCELCGSLKDLVRIAEARVTRRLTRAERRRYGL
jgi:WD40 repeat protein